MQAKIRSAFFMLLILLSPAAWAQVIGPGVEPTGLPTDFGFIDPINSNPNWVIGEIAPIEVIPCANCEPWIKNLNLSPGTSQTPISTQYTLWENIIVGGTNDWIDWHEDILTPGWEWTAGSIFLTGGGMAVPIPGLVVSADQPFSGDPDSPSISIWFDFDPLAPGTAITIAKTIRCNGAGGAACAGSFIQVAEYPSVSAIPEPTTLALLGIGLAGLGFGRRRNTV